MLRVNAQYDKGLLISGVLYCADTECVVVIVVLHVACCVTVVCSSRPLRVRYEQKVAKYSLIADRNNIQFVPAVFSQTGRLVKFMVLLRVCLGSRSVNT